MRTIQEPFVAPAYVHLSDWKYEDKVFHREPSWIVTRLLLVTTLTKQQWYCYLFWTWSCQKHTLASHEVKVPLNWLPPTQFLFLFF